MLSETEKSRGERRLKLHTECVVQWKCGRVPNDWKNVVLSQAKIGRKCKVICLPSKSGEAFGKTVISHKKNGSLDSCCGKRRNKIDDGV